MHVVFGGGLWPLGQSVGFVESSLDETLGHIRRWAGSGDLRVRIRDLGTTEIEAQLATLLPFQAPYKRHLLVDTRSGWTAIFDNSRGGGDPFSFVSQLSKAASVRGVLAGHTPHEQHALPATQLHLFGPDGEPPLLYVRTIDCGIFDSGRWSFRTSGEPQPFENPTRYEARRIRDRFDRALLLEYLATLGLTPEDPGWYGAGARLDDKGWWRPGWTASLEEARAEATDHLRSPDAGDAPAR